MKKVVLSVLIVIMCVMLCACTAGVELSLDTKYTVKNHITFNLHKIYTTNKVTASIPGSSYYSSDDGEVYVDVILDVVNISTDDMDCDEIVDVSATNSRKAELDDCHYAVETKNNTDLSSSRDILPLASARLHCMLSVPETETSVTIKIKAGNEEFFYDYNIGETVVNAAAINVGATLDNSEYAKLQFNGIEFKDKVLPQDTSSAYRYYEVDDESNTYLVVSFDITNYMADDVDCDKIVGVRALFDDKYNYTGFVVVEEEDKRGFSQYDEISPLTTRRLYCLIEVPDIITDTELSLSISFDKGEYVYTVQ